jgi:hypothetical protein
MEFAVAMQFGRDDGDEILAVQPRAVTDGPGGKARVGPLMVRQAGEIIASLTIEAYHLCGLVSAIRMGAVAVKIAAVDSAGRAEQVSGHGVGLPQVGCVIAAVPLTISDHSHRHVPIVTSKCQNCVVKGQPL